MSHVRCFAHAVITVVALGAWVGVGWLLYYAPTANDPLRLPFFALLGVAVGASSLALFPVVVASYLKRYTDIVDLGTALEATYHLGSAKGVKQERRKCEVLHAPRGLSVVDNG